MNDEKLVYLESDEEITSVIDKISRVSGDDVVLVIPRGGSLAQSIVNLKLIKKRSADLGKDVSLVTTDKISRNLASQVGVSVYSRVEEVGKRKVEVPVVVSPVKSSEAETIKSEVPAPEAQKPAEELPEIPGVKINRYYDKRPRESKVESPKSKVEQLENTTQEVEGTPKVEEPAIELPAANTSSNISELSFTGDTEPDISENRKPITDNHVDRSEFKNRTIEDFIPEAPKDEEPKSDSKKLETHKQSNDQSPSEEPKRMKAGRRFKPMKRRRALAILIASALVVVLAFGYLILPQAKAVVTFKADNFEDSVEVKLDKSVLEIDAGALVSPATESSVEKEIEDTFQATGKKNIGNKASGEITFYNYIELTAQKITSGATLTANGKSFVTEGDFTIPAVTVTSVIPFASSPGTVKGKVVAADPGEDSNLSSGTKFTFTAFSGNKQNNIYGQSAATLTGGSTQEVQVVQQSDLQAAEVKIKARLSAEAKDEALKKIPSIEKFIEGTFDEKISDLSASVAANTQAPTFKYKGKVRVVILSFNETNLRDVLVASYEKNLAANRVMVQPENISFEYSVAAKNMDAGTANYKVTYKGKVSSKIDQEKLKNEISGKSFAEAKKILGGLDLAKDVSITMVPNLSIYTNLPLLSRSIRIETIYTVE